MRRRKKNLSNQQKRLKKERLEKQGGYTWIERKLWKGLIAALPSNIYSQYQIGPYIADFYISYNGIRLVIEADGKEWHSSEKQIARDAKRDEYLRRQGFTVIRFTGSKICKEINSCIDEVIGMLGASRNDFLCRFCGTPSYDIVHARCQQANEALSFALHNDRY